MRYAGIRGGEGEKVMSLSVTVIFPSTRLMSQKQAGR
jgi:hypothetical protein